jgi:hypothetical protein
MTLSSRFEWMSKRNTSRVSRWLCRPLSNQWCLIGLLGVIAAMIAVAILWGGPTSADATAPDNATWLIAHGDFACAYPPASSVVYPTTAPLYPLISGAFATVAHVGDNLKFPSSTHLGSTCVAAVTALYHWSFHAHALEPTLRFGYFGWLAILAGVMLVIRALGKGRSRLEVVTMAAVACLPSVYMPLFQFFHPEDLMATGLALAGVAFVLRDKWMVAGLLLGLAVLSQQFALLFIIPLVVVAPRTRLIKAFGGMACSVIGVGLPLLIVTSGRAITSLLVGTGDVGGSNTTFYGIPVHGSREVVLLRLVAILLGALAAWWARDRLKGAALEPVALLALLGLSLALRLWFEVSLFGYYLMPVSVLLLIAEIAAGRLRLLYVIWTVVATWATVSGGLVNHGTFAGVDVGLWQFLIAGVAVYLAARPLLAVERSRSPVEPTSVSQ